MDEAFAIPDYEHGRVRYPLWAGYYIDAYGRHLRLVEPAGDLIADDMTVDQAERMVQAFRTGAAGQGSVEAGGGSPFDEAALEAAWTRLGAAMASGGPPSRTDLREAIEAYEVAHAAAAPDPAPRHEGALTAMREAGWSVAVHNDYRLNGEPHTFWLFTHPLGRWVKGEGRSDEEALEAALRDARR